MSRHAPLTDDQRAEAAARAVEQVSDTLAKRYRRRSKAVAGVVVNKTRRGK